MKLRRNLILFLLICVLALLSACGDAPDAEVLAPETESGTESDTEGAPEEGPHTHEFTLTETVSGTCLEQGYNRYDCSCGMSYKSLIPSAHSYKTVKDVTGQYTKKVCESCGDYTIVRNQTYLYNIDFENASSVGDAANQPPNLEFYVAAGGTATVEKDEDGSYMSIATANYYVRDKSGIFVSGETFVLSMDLKVEKFAKAELISIAYQNGDKWVYNRGIVRLEADGSLGFYSDGNGVYTQKVYLSTKGYNNITLVGDMKTRLFDVYVNGELVREEVYYSVSAPSKDTTIYVRYFDQKKDFVASADNLKLYEAKLPEFIVPSSGIVFAE